MRCVDSIEKLGEWVDAYRRAGLCVGFVPTLGALHEGHLSLMRRAREDCHRVVVSIYLNPTQFDAAADLDTYPSSVERDLEACRAVGVDLVFLGKREEMLPDGFVSWVEVEELTDRLCGAHRPGHFRGVTTVVTQLLHVARPHRAYFGLKDFQQARVIQRMVRDLRFPVEIRVCPIVRESDGLALSSRNLRLSKAEREVAPHLHRSLAVVRDACLSGERMIDSLTALFRAEMAREPAFEVEYFEVLDASSLEVSSRGRVEGEVVMAAAANLGATRLMDNLTIDTGKS